MKAVFLFLVLMNLAYLGWQTWIVPSKAPPALVEADGIPRLVLIGEDPNDPVFSTPYSPRKMPLEVAPQVVRDVAAEIPDEPAPTQVQPDERSEEQNEQSSGETVALQTADAPTPTPIQIAEVDEAPDAVEVAMAPAGLSCVSLGPFLNLREATEATAVLIEANLDPSQRLSESQVWFGHWVHMPPQASREAAIAVVENLKKQGVSDIYIEPSGPMQNAISLGVFSDRKHAETRAGVIRKLGISPQIRDRYRDSSVYWVDFELPQGKVIDPSEYQDNSRRVLRIEGRACPENG